MSFAYMPFFTGDYLRDTRHLSMCEHGAYMLALMHCWDLKGPMPLDERKQFAIVCARSGDEMEAWRRVREELFVRMDDGWYQPRMQREIERSENLSRTRSEAGRRGYQAKAKQLPSKSQAIAKQEPLTPSPSPSLSPSPSQAGKTKTRTLGVAELVSLGVQRQHAEDWLKARLAKRLPLTKTALQGVQDEAAKAGLTLAQAIAKAAENGWAGFRASWSSDSVRQQGGKQAALEALNRQAIDEFVNAGHRHE